LIHGTPSGDFALSVVFAWFPVQRSVAPGIDRQRLAHSAAGVE
jgi:hypothetical protein